MSIQGWSFGVLLGCVVVLGPSTARADMCEDPCTPCSVESRCPKSGVACYVDGDDYDTCKADAEGKGLELRCERSDAIFCDPAEEEYTEEERAADEEEAEDADDGCSVRKPHARDRGLGVALVTFAVAAAATGVRAVRRRRR